MWMYDYLSTCIFLRKKEPHVHLKTEEKVFMEKEKLMVLDGRDKKIIAIPAQLIILHIYL